MVRSEEVNRLLEAVVSGGQRIETIIEASISARRELKKYESVIVDAVVLESILSSYEHLLQKALS